jgi:RND family efflux transporter MFP subunit
MRRALATIATAVTITGCGGSQPAAPSPSVLVTLENPVQGTLPDVLAAYGSAGPSLNGSQTLSVPQSGQVTKLTTIPGEAVRAGQALVVFTVDPQSLSAYLQAASALSAAETQRETTAQLLAQQLATRDQLTQADKAVSDAAAALAALRRNGGGEAVRELKAPFDGVVTAVPVAEGDRTQPGAALVTVAKTSSIVVTAGIDPAARTGVRPGQPATLERLTGGAPIDGTVLRVNSALNLKTRQVDVELGFPAGALMPGEGLRVGIRVGDISGWVVPHRAVVTANGPPRVYQAANGKAVPVPVTVALVTPDKDVVQGAIDPKLGLIVDGAYQVEDGIGVRVVGP